MQKKSRKCDNPSHSCAAIPCDLGQYRNRGKHSPPQYRVRTSLSSAYYPTFFSTKMSPPKNTYGTEHP